MEKPIALVQISNPEDMRIAPLALLFVGDTLKKAGYEPKVFHVNSEKLQAAVKDILSVDPMLVGLSVITGNQTRESANLSKMLKAEKPELPILWGGVHPTLLPRETVKEDYIDYVANGEGDTIILDIVRMLEGKVKPEEILGLCFKNNGVPVVNAPRPLIEDLDQLDLDFDLINVEDHLEREWSNKRVLGFITSRGCPFDCKFCYNLRFNLRRWRAMSEKKVVEKVKYLKDMYNIDGIKFYDDLIFSDPQRAIRILEEVKLPWYGEVRVGMLDEPLVKKLVETQCRELLLGLESGSNRLLAMMKKLQTVDHIKRGIRNLTKAPDVKPVGSFIMGLPTETKEETFQTIDLALELSQVNPKARFSFGFYLPYPGSDLYDTALRMGFVPPTKTEDWDCLDRWAGNLQLTWLDWVKDSAYFRRIRDYFNLLPLREVNIPILSKIPEKRLREKDFEHPTELQILSSLQKKYSHKDNLFSKVVLKSLPYIRSPSQPAYA
ncbi:MAG TPA: radical SAM protein [Candidatus Nanoarchaeia archaeon]|nr:radical SAM protein [Candidatus Nanoarchaeia archaeon]